jgi:hypothetical protein
MPGVKFFLKSLEVMAIALPLAAMTYFLFDQNAFNAFLDWLIKLAAAF